MKTEKLRKRQVSDTVFGTLAVSSHEISDKLQANFPGVGQIHQFLRVFLAVYRNPYVSSTRDVEITNSEAESKDDTKDAKPSVGIAEHDGRPKLIGNALHLLS
jgi:hypothetical protein